MRCNFPRVIPSGVVVREAGDGAVEGPRVLRSSQWRDRGVLPRRFGAPCELLDGSVGPRATWGPSTAGLLRIREAVPALRMTRLPFTMKNRHSGEFMPDDRNFHMTPEEFRRNGHAVVDWIADYYKRIESYPVLSRVAPGEIRALLPAAPPASGEPFAAILADIERLILPGITHWQSPNFFAFFPSNASGPAILGDLLSSGLGVQGMLWATSPACTELETRVLDWLVEMLGLPAKFLSSGSGGGVIQDTASSSALCALLAARERATQFDSNRKGCHGGLT